MLHSVGERIANSFRENAFYVGSAYGFVSYYNVKTTEGTTKKKAFYCSQESNCDKVELDKILLSGDQKSILFLDLIDNRIAYDERLESNVYEIDFNLIFWYNKNKLGETGCNVDFVFLPLIANRLKSIGVDISKELSLNQIISTIKFINVEDKMAYFTGKYGITGYRCSMKVNSSTCVEDYVVKPEIIC